MDCISSARTCSVSPVAARGCHGGVEEQPDLPFGPEDQYTCDKPPLEATGDLFQGESRYLWGAKGHSMINNEAGRELPADMPQFFAEARSELAILGSHPDRWKFRSLNGLGSVNRPDHWINQEILGGRELPTDRYAYLGLIINDGLQRPDREPAKVGFLPYAIAEHFEKLQAEFALWRREVHSNGEDTPMARQLAQNAIYTAGIMGHFVADASQPLHTTVHGNGWDPTYEENTENFSTDPGIHSRFESRYVNAAVPYNGLQKNMQPARVLEGESLQLAKQFINQSHSHVRDLYRLDRDSKLSPEHPTPEGTEFAEARLTEGAQFLRDLWYTAWKRSERLALEVEDPIYQGANDFHIAK